MVSQTVRDRLQKRLEHQLTPDEPDPEDTLRENSREFLESQVGVFIFGCFEFMTELY